ncbi:hypothetical protein BKA93DRAFT_829719 [Sparassis latifolia]
MHALNSVKVYCEVWEDVMAFGALLRDAGPNIIEVNFNPSGPIMDISWDPVTNEMDRLPTDAWNVLNFASCTSLQTLVFAFDLDHYPENIPLIEMEWNSFIDILSPISQTLRRLTFRIDVWEAAFEYMNDWQIINWDRMHRALDRFKELSTVTFELCLVGWDRDQEDGFRECCEMIEAMTPELRERSLLRFVQREDRHFH